MTAKVNELSKLSKYKDLGTEVLYRINNKETAKLFQGAQVSMPVVLKTNNGFIHSITGANSPVKPKFSSVTETQQFIRWFGDWNNKPKSVSKVVDKDGKPLVVYHQTNADYKTVEIASNKSASLDLVTLFVTKNKIKGNQSVPPATNNSSSQRGSVSSTNIIPDNSKKSTLLTKNPPTVSTTATTSQR